MAEKQKDKYTKTMRSYPCRTIMELESFVNTSQIGRDDIVQIVWQDNLQQYILLYYA